MEAEKQINPQLAVLVIQSWKASPALCRWFKGLTGLHDYLQQFDLQTASTMCRAHLEAKGNHTPPLAANNERILEKPGAVASWEKSLLLRVWYNVSIQRFYKYLDLWFVFYLAASITVH